MALCQKVQSLFRIYRIHDRFYRLKTSRDSTSSHRRHICPDTFPAENPASIYRLMSQYRILEMVLAVLDIEIKDGQTVP